MNKIIKFLKNQTILIFLFTFITICCNSIIFAAINTNMQINGEAYVRVDENIRITDVILNSCSNGTLEKYSARFSKDTMSIGFQTSNSTTSVISYTVTLTNKSNNSYFISYDAESLPANYSIISQKNDLIIEPNSTKNIVVEISSDSPNNVLNNIILNFNYVKGYKVEYDANGGTTSIAYQYIKENGQYADMPIPTRESHDFLGWFSSLNNGEKVENGSNLISNSDHTLYANWEDLSAPPEISISLITAAGTKANAYFSVSDSDADIDCSNIYKASDKTKVTSSSRENNKCVYSGLEQNTKYYFYVVATGSNGKSSFYGGSFTTEDCSSEQPKSCSAYCDESCSSQINSVNSCMSYCESQGMGSCSQFCSGPLSSLSSCQGSCNQQCNQPNNPNNPNNNMTQYNACLNSNFVANPNDTTNPSVNITSNITISSTELEINFNVTDDTGISNIKCEYGTNTEYKIEGVVTSYGSSHKCKLSNLLRDQTYYYKISATDYSKNTGSSTGNLKINYCSGVGAEASSECSAIAENSCNSSNFINSCNNEATASCNGSCSSSCPSSSSGTNPCINACLESCKPDVLASCINRSVSNCKNGTVNSCINGKLREAGC